MPGARAPGSGRQPSHQERTAPAEEPQQKTERSGATAELRRSCNEAGATRPRTGTKRSDKAKRSARGADFARRASRDWAHRDSPSGAGTSAPNQTRTNRAVE